MTKKIYGIVGYPLHDSLSPVMHNAAFKAAKIDAEYKVFEIDPEAPEDLANFCYESDLNHLKGFSVTMPYKERIMDYLDYFDPLAKKLGVVNTVKNEDSNLNGYNTDAMGAIQALQEKIKISGKKALVLGAGGAARAIIYTLHELGAEVYVWSRDPLQAEELAEEFDLTSIPFSDIRHSAFDLIINATPVGSGKQVSQSLLTAEEIPKNALVMDIITHPLETKLLQEAKKAGAQTISGERMLLHQAAGQFEVWFNRPAPFNVMEKALYKEINKKQA